MKHPRTQRAEDGFVGTAQYLSPEVLLDKESGPAADLWALGCIVYQLFVGMSPFNSKTEYWTFQAITKGNVNYPAVSPKLHRE